MAVKLQEIRGHQILLDRLSKAAAAKKLGAVSILAGPEGVGKRQVAMALAQILVCETGGVAQAGACGNCGPCKRMSSLQSESLLTVSPSTNQLKLEDVEPIRSFLSLQALGKARVVVIDSAETLNGAAANMMLKTFEEPPPNTYFFLITSVSHALLPTIRSRAQTYRFGPLPDGALGENTAPAWWSSLSEGRADLFRRHLTNAAAESGRLDFVENALTALRTAFEDNRFQGWPLLKELAETRETTEDAISIWALAISRLFKTPTGSLGHPELQNIAGKIGLGTEGASSVLVSILENLLTSEKSVAGNVDRTLVLESIWYQIAESTKRAGQELATH